MLDFFIRSSGLIAAFTTWWLVVTPAERSGFDTKIETISSLSRHDHIRRSVNTGLLTGSLFQLVFLYYLVTKFNIPVLSIGVVLYALTTVTAMTVAYFSEQSNPKMHLVLVKTYLVGHPLALLVLAASTGDQLITVFTAVIVLFYFGGTWLLYRRSGFTTKVEEWIFFLLTIWTVFMTIV